MYGGVFAKNLPVFGGVTPGHTVGDVPFLLRNDNMLAHLTAGEEKQFARYAEDVSSAVLSFATTGDPGTKKLQVAGVRHQQGTLMVFDEKSGARDHHEQGSTVYSPTWGADACSRSDASRETGSSDVNGGRSRLAHT